MFMPSGPVEFLFVLFEMANCTCAMVSCISLVRKVLIVSMYLLILFVLQGDSAKCAQIKTHLSDL